MTPQGKGFLDRVKAARFDVGAQCVEKTPILRPNLGRIYMSRFSVLRKLKELPYRVDIAVARRINLVAKFFGRFFRERRWGRLDIENGETILLQIIRNMLRETAARRGDLVFALYGEFLLIKFSTVSGWASETPVRQKLRGGRPV